MPKIISSGPPANHILARLSAADFELLRPALRPVGLPVSFQIEDPDQLVRYVYFVEQGIVSVVANGLGKRSIEVGIIGPEGMTGLAVVMGIDRSVNKTFVQIAGSAQRMTAAHLRAAIARSVTLHHAFLRYAHAFMAQTAGTALANGRSKIDERLARWLLMAHDRVTGNDIVLTHEFLSVMLGVRRAGVTEAIKLLENAGLVRSRRGVITVLDRAGLEKGSDGTYVAEKRTRSSSSARRGA